LQSTRIGTAMKASGLHIRGAPLEVGGRVERHSMARLQLARRR